MANLIQLKDKNGTKGYPLTLAEAVICSDGENLEMIVNEKGNVFQIDGTKKASLIIKEMLGKTIQNGTPTISNPIPLNHVKTDFINNGNSVHGNVELHGLETASGELISDRLFLSHGKFYVERKVKEVDMGNLAWAVYQSGIYRVDLEDAFPYNNASLAQKGSLCSSFKLLNSTVAQMQDGNYKWASSSNPKRYYFKDTSKEDVNSFRESVAGQKICYVLENPYIEEVGAEEVLNLLNLESYDGATTLSQTSDAKGEMEITVAKNSAGGIVLDSYSASIEMLASFIHIVS